MAVINYAIQQVMTFADHVHLLTWGPMANGDSGQPLSMPGSADQSIQIAGTFGAGGTVVLEGSNDGTNYFTLTNPQGSALSFTAAGLRAITENCQFIRPHVTAGDGTTAITAVACVRRVLNA